MQTMYPGKVNSPSTVLDGGINDIVTTINVVDGSVLPVAPNIAVIGTGEDAETILYANRAGNVLSNVTRGFQGAAKSWSSGEAIARLFTEYDYASLKANLETLAGRKITDFAECNSEELAGKITDELGTGKLMFGYEGEWTAVIRGSGTAGTYEIASQLSHYTKIGRVVHLESSITMAGSITGGGSGYLQITGNPFTKMVGSVPVGSISVTGIDFTAAYLTVGFVSPSATSILAIIETIDNAGDDEVDIDEISANDKIRFSITFFI